MEATDITGGSARTDVTAEGFAFDQGGHVIFSHSKYFDDLIASACTRFDRFHSSLTLIKNRLEYD